MLTRARICALSVFAVSAVSPAFGQASFGTLGYSESFDSMGTGGTVAPLGWRHFVTSFGTNTTWSTGIPGSGTNSVATMAVTTAATVLTATANPTTTNNSGFNAANTLTNVSDRVLAASPTTVAGAMLQLQLQNNSGGDLVTGQQLSINFDTIRYRAAAEANELPGYWLFISLDGTSWTNVGPNPTLTEVPNTVGTTTSALTYTLASNWASGSSAHFRWVDDNAVQTSPDQIIGLNNVGITLIPTPGAAGLTLLGSLVAMKRRR